MAGGAHAPRQPLAEPPTQRLSKSGSLHEQAFQHGCALPPRMPCLCVQKGACFYTCAPRPLPLVSGPMSQTHHAGMCIKDSRTRRMQLGPLAAALASTAESVLTLKTWFCPGLVSWGRVPCAAAPARVSALSVLSPAADARRCCQGPLCFQVCPECRGLVCVPASHARLFICRLHSVRILQRVCCGYSDEGCCCWKCHPDI